MTIHCKAVEQYFTVVLFVFQFYPMFENLSILDLALSGVKGLRFNNVFINETLYEQSRLTFVHIPLPEDPVLPPFLRLVWHLQQANQSPEIKTYGFL